MLDSVTLCFPNNKSPHLRSMHWHTPRHACKWDLPFSLDESGSKMADLSEKLDSSLVLAQIYLISIETHHKSLLDQKLISPKLLAEWHQWDRALSTSKSFFLAGVFLFESKWWSWDSCLWKWFLIRICTCQDERLQ